MIPSSAESLNIEISLGVCIQTQINKCSSVGTLCIEFQFNAPFCHSYKKPTVKRTIKTIIIQNPMWFRNSKCTAQGNIKANSTSNIKNMIETKKNCISKTLDCVSEKGSKPHS